jgi:hypothetical protein
MKMMTLEYSPLIADIYWTRAVQYYGGKRLGQDTNLEACGRYWMWPLRSIRICCRPIVLARTFLESQNRVVPAARPCSQAARTRNAERIPMPGGSIRTWKYLLSGTERFPKPVKRIWMAARSPGQLRG